MNDQYVILAGQLGPSLYDPHQDRIIITTSVERAGDRWETHISYFPFQNESPQLSPSETEQEALRAAHKSILDYCEKHCIIPIDRTSFAKKPGETEHKEPKMREGLTTKIRRVFDD